MGYEFNPASKRFEIPNPHRVENVFLAIAAAAAVSFGITALLAAGSAFGQHQMRPFLTGLAVAVALLAAGFWYLVFFMRQLKFFFGRGKPADLVPSLHDDEEGYRAWPAGDERQIADARTLRETLQQNAIRYPTPSSAIDNLLVALVPNLIYSARLTQKRVASQFRNALGLGFLLVCFSVALAGVHDRAAVAWIGAFFFALTAAVVLRPLAAGGQSSARLSQAEVIAIIAASIVGPVVLAQLVPRGFNPFAGIVDFVPITFIALVSAMVITILVIVAGIATTVKPTSINIAPWLETVNITITPAQVYAELNRELQRLWFEQVPNRRYMRILPDTSAREGTFHAHVIEETQPLARDLDPMTWRRAFTLPTTCWLAVADVLSTIITVAGAYISGQAAAHAPAYTQLLSGGALMILGAYGFCSANGFWRRFEFESKVYWIEWSGNYARAATKIGALLSDRVHTDREIISVESMTLRVWVAEIDSVAFSTDEDRDMVSLRGLPDEAKRVAQTLAVFTQGQASLIVPSPAEDRKRLTALQLLNSAMPPPPVPLSEMPTAAFAALQTNAQSNVPSGAAAFCAHCGAPIAIAEAAFCSRCGKALHERG